MTDEEIDYIVRNGTSKTIVTHNKGVGNKESLYDDLYQLMRWKTGSENLIFFEFLAVKKVE